MRGAAREHTRYPDSRIRHPGECRDPAVGGAVRAEKRGNGNGKRRSISDPPTRHPDESRDPARSGIADTANGWIPAFAGMTVLGVTVLGMTVLGMTVLGMTVPEPSVPRVAP